MRDLNSPTWVSAFGLPVENLPRLFDLVRSVIPERFPIFDDQTITTLLRRPELQVTGAVSCFQGNLNSVGKAIDANPSVKAIILLEDPRTLLARQDERVAGCYSYGFDHNLHVAANGVVTRSAPGLDHMAQLLRAIVGRRPPTLVVRNDVLCSSPEKVTRDLKAFIGDGSAESDTIERDWPGGKQLPQSSARRVVRQFHLHPKLFDIAARWATAQIDRGSIDWVVSRCVV